MEYRDLGGVARNLRGVARDLRGVTGTYVE